MGHASSVVANQTTVVSSTDVKTLSLQSYFSEADVQALLAVYKARTSAGGSLHNPGSVHTMHTLHITPTALHCATLPIVLLYSCWQPMLFAGAPSGNVCYGGHRSSVQHAVPVCTLPARGMYDAAAAAVVLHVELVNGQRGRGRDKL